MFHVSRQHGQKAQTLLEYSIVIGLVAAIIVAMGPMIGRTTNGYIKLVADQIGEQEGAEQNFDKDGGHLKYSYVTQKSTIKKDRVEVPGDAGYVRYVFDDVIEGTSNTFTNLGIR